MMCNSFVDHDVRWTRRAEKLRGPLPREVINAIDQAAQNLVTNPRPDGVAKLRGELEGLWRIRIRRNYRLIYAIDDAERTVTIVDVGDRGRIY
jgi:mRNA interferase RelE/StbE